MKPYLPLALTAGLLLAAGAPGGDAAKDELKKLEGSWRITSVELAGKPIPGNAQRLGTITIKGKQITMGEQGAKTTTMGLTIDPTKKPKAMDLRITRGDETVDWKCIYSLKDDQLKICMPLTRKKGDNTPGPTDLNKRPDSFDTAGKPRMLLIAKRQAAK